MLNEYYAYPSVDCRNVACVQMRCDVTCFLNYSRSSIIIFLRSNLLLVDSLIFHQFANCCKKRCFYKERTQIFIKFKNFEKEYLLFDYVIIYPITVLLLREISFPLVSCYFLSLRTFHLNIMNFKQYKCFRNKKIQRNCYRI